MSHVLVVEDNKSDLRQSTAVLRKLQFSQVQVASTVESALMLFQDAVEGSRPAPDLVLLDLSFARDSGFEVLRYWRSHQEQLKNTRIVVWTIMGETEQELCRYFGVDVVPKWAGPAELESVLQGYLSAHTKSAE